MRVYQVGGAVRDMLLGLPVREKDWVVVGSSPEQMLADGYRPVGKDFPVFLHPETHEEYALARTERKTSPGYQGFVFHADESVTLEEDLLRRDLTINAIAKASDGSLIDPYGGQRDIEARVLRHVSDAFVEDPVRVLRIARFLAQFAPLGFTIAPETMILLQEMVRSGEVGALVTERVWQELEKGLATDAPDAFFQLLRDCGALKIVFPEIDALFGVPNCRAKFTIVDAGLQALFDLRSAASQSASLPTRFAAMVMGVGKARVAPGSWGRDIDYSLHSVEALNNLFKNSRVPKGFQHTAMIAAKLSYDFFTEEALTAAKCLAQLNILDVWRRPEQLDMFVELAAVCGHTCHFSVVDKLAKLQEAYLVSKAVSVDEFIAAGLKGTDIKKALSNHRLELIQHIVE